MNPSDKNFFIGSVLITVFAICMVVLVVVSINSAHEQREQDAAAHLIRMQGACYPERFAKEEKVADDLYKITCLSLDGKERTVFQDRKK